VRFVDEEDLPVEIKEHELPKDDTKKYQMFYNSRVRTSGGFTDAIFLGAIMLVCFMWGLLVAVLR